MGNATSKEGTPATATAATAVSDNNNADTAVISLQICT
jgi:hypothetical protein